MRRTMVGLLVLGSLALAGCSSSIGTSSTTTSAAGSSSSGGSSTPSTAADSVVGTIKWGADNHGVVTSLAGDTSALVTSLPAAVSARSAAGVTAQCQKLATDLAAAKALPPIPNSTAQQTWSSVLTSLTTASDKCTSGAASNDVNSLSEASSTLTGVSGQLTTLSRSLGI